MRLYLLSLAIPFLCLYAFKDWYKSLCGLIVLMALVERPDMPKSMLGIPGMNFWNILLAFILMAYLASRKRDGLKWDMPENLSRYFKLYIAIIVIATIRELIDPKEMIIFALGTGAEPPSVFGLFVDDVINTFKYLVPAFLIYIGCTNEQRLKFAYASILLLNVLLALQVIRWMPLTEITDGDALKDRAARVLDREIGYYRSDLAIMLAGASWAIYAYREVLTNKFLSFMALGGCAVTALGMVLTGGRIGIVSWIAVAVVLTYYRWRKFLILAPLAVLLIGLAIPSVMERMTQGFTEDTAEERHEDLDADTMTSTTGGADLYTITAGRTVMWPYVIDYIGDKPLFGWGRKGMQRSGLSAYLGRNFREAFPHPHNAYLQLLFDNGWILSIPVFLLFYIFVRFSINLLRDSTNKLYIAIGGGTLAFVGAQLIGSTGSQTFYPATGAVSMWCMIALMLRVYVQRNQYNELMKESDGSTEPDLWAKIEKPAKIIK